MPTSKMTAGAVRARSRFLAALLVPLLWPALSGCSHAPRPAGGDAAAEGARHDVVIAQAPCTPGPGTASGTPSNGPRMAADEPLPAQVSAEMGRVIAAVESGTAPAESLLVVLARAGYLHAAVRRDANGAWSVSPGPRTTEAACRWIEGRTRSGASSPRPLADVAWEQGVCEGIDGQMKQVLERYDREGFPLARVELADFACDSSLQIAARFDPGPRVRVTGLDFAGRHASRPGFLRRVAGWQGPEWYRAERWLRARDELRATGLFDEVSGPFLLLPPRATSSDAGTPDALAGDTGSPMASAGSDADSIDAVLLFRLLERPASRVSGVLGYSNPEDQHAQGGMTGFLDLSLGNLLGTGRATRLYWQSWGSQRSTFEFAWHEPFLWRIPVGIDASLRHVQEDTLYAETTWGADLVWNVAPLWQVGIGWGRTRLVLGEPLSRTLGRAETRFRVAYRDAPEAGGYESERSAGWAAAAEVAQSDGDDETRRRLDVRLDEWLGRVWRLQLRQETGLLTGPDSLLRGDAFVLGGSQNLRGSAEGEVRAFGYALQRTEFGPRIDARGSRLYLLADVARIEPWEAGPDLLRGRRAHGLWRWAAGVGIEVPSQAGRFRLEYAVPGGESPWRGRLHFGVLGTF